jgi:hypothetical protein
MRRKKYGFILIALLVLSGLAGTPYDTALNKKERKTLITEMRESRTAFLNSINGLSNGQLDFVPSEGKPSIREYATQVMNTQDLVYQKIDALMKQSSNGRDRIQIKWTDEEIPTGISYWLDKELKPGKSNTNSNLQSMIRNFIRGRSRQVNYVKTTTEDLRNHVMPHPFFGQLDCYQWLLVLSHQCKEITAQIEKVKTDPGFPTH